MEFIHALWSENTSSTQAEFLGGAELHQIFSLNSSTIKYPLATGFLDVLMEVVHPVEIL